MTLLIGSKQPVTSLKDKKDGFKFQAPKLRQQPKKEVAIPEVDLKSNPTNTGMHVGKQKPKPTADIQNANKLLDGKSKPKSLLTPKSAPKNTLIPAMSTDKYEVVEGSIPEFSEDAGNKFQEQIEMLQQAVDGTGELKDQMVNILTFLDDNPQYKDNVSPKDVAVFVAACRKVAGITVQEKTVRKTKVTKSTAKVEEVLSDLADLSFEL